MPRCSLPTSPSISGSQDYIATPVLNIRKLVKYTLGGGALVLLVLGFYGCSVSSTTEACPQPAAGSEAESSLATVRQRSSFDLLYPCYLPNSQALESSSIIGEAGKQRAELVFTGPFDMTLRQSQTPPPFTPDPTGSSHITVQLFDGVQGTLIERNDGTSKALYHLYWERFGRFFELQVFGPPLQRDAVLRVARSLETPPPVTTTP